mmetsp:Transcript_36075/g.75016  ORF Transcript_36075/g.75016 Transcript_36075/m.75016 type:complete len:244 (-) Transcript_36075:168-899(-)
MAPRETKRRSARSASRAALSAASAAAEDMAQEEHAAIANRILANNNRRSRSVERLELQQPRATRRPLSSSLTSTHAPSHRSGRGEPIDERQQQEAAVPPAALNAIFALPHARVLPHQREEHKDSKACCSVCFDRLIDGIAMVRLPCSHVFHLTCAVDWLSRKCTCPECRYEIETTDAQYEKGRKERMAQRETHKCACPPSARAYHPCFFDALAESDKPDTKNAQGSSSKTLQCLPVATTVLSS